MTRNELLMLISNCEKQHERKKEKRFAYTVLFYAAVFFGIFYWQDQLEGANIWEVLGVVVACLIVSVVTCLFNALVFGQLEKVSREEQEAIDFLRKRLKEKEKENK